MKKLVQEKEHAIALRKKGLSYNEILKQIPVAKSSLSLWLKDLPLTPSEKAVLRRRKNSNISKGRIKAAAAHRKNRLEREKIIFREAEKEFRTFVKEPLFQVGLALYWAEGAKRSTVFGFANSDPEMIRAMLQWMKRYFNLDPNTIPVRLYLHKPYAHEHCEEYWSREIGVPLANFKKTVFKPTGLLVKKRPNYKGCLRIEYCKVAYFKKLKFWQQMFIEYLAKQR